MAHGWMGCLRKLAQRTDAGQTASGVLRTAVNRNISMTRELQPAYTRRLKPDPENDGVSVGQHQVNRYGATHAGSVRRLNEDGFSVLTFRDKTLLAVADGMGGHDSGEVASRIALDALCSFVQKTGDISTDLLALVAGAVQHANRTVWNEGVKRGSDMGTTLSAALITDSTAYVAHVGDSRVYWIENGSIGQVTVDHSVVAKLVAAGKISKHDARGHPRSNILYRTIGNEADVIVDRFTQPLKSGGVLLLCTDGLWNELSDEDIHTVLAAEKEMSAACDRLVAMANESGGRDNITVVALKVE